MMAIVMTNAAMSTKKQTTYMPTQQDALNRVQWFVLNAEGKTLGRLASQIAHVLRGKHKPHYAPFLDMGDFVIVTQVDKLAVTGNKLADKQYHHHTGYPGGIKTEALADLQARQPGRVLLLAVKRMLPRGPLGRQMLKKLKLYAGAEHPHVAQQPIDFFTQFKNNPFFNCRDIKEA